jgi:hypothetical protein
VIITIAAIPAVSGLSPAIEQPPKPLDKLWELPPSSETRRSGRDIPDGSDCISQFVFESKANFFLVPFQFEAVRSELSWSPAVSPVPMTWGAAWIL